MIGDIIVDMLGFAMVWGVCNLVPWIFGSTWRFGWYRTDHVT